MCSGQQEALSSRSAPHLPTLFPRADCNRIFSERDLQREIGAMDVGKSCVAASVVDPCNLQAQIWQMFRSVKKADMQLVKNDGFRQRIGWCRNYPSKQKDAEYKESEALNEGPQQEQEEENKEGSAPADLPVLALEERNADHASSVVIPEEVSSTRKACDDSVPTAPPVLECSIVNADRDVFLVTDEEEKAKQLLFTGSNNEEVLPFSHHDKSEEEEREYYSEEQQMAATTTSDVQQQQPPVVDGDCCSALKLEATETSPPAPTLAAENLKKPGGNITLPEEISSPVQDPLEPSTTVPLQESSGSGEVLHQQRGIASSTTNVSQTQILLNVKAEPVDEQWVEMDATYSQHAHSAKVSHKPNVCSIVKREPTTSEGRTDLPNRNPATHKETTTSGSSGEDNSTCSEDDAIKTARIRRVQYVMKKAKTKPRTKMKRKARLVDWDGEVEDELCPNKCPKLESSAVDEIKKPRNRNPGRRVQGGRLYDSVLGQTCHWCRQKTVELHVKCWDCTIRFCGPCLLNRNGERIREELCEGVHWVCPKCRGGCGPGCRNCCNCGPCRKADGKSPTGQQVFAARIAGFDNVHDFLVHLETGESPVVIARRKDSREWTNGGRFKCEEAPGDFLTEAHKDSCLDGHKDVAPRTADMSTKLQMKILCRKYAKKVLLARKKMRGAISADSPAAQGRMPGAVHHKSFSLPKMKNNGQVPHLSRGNRTRTNRAGHATCKVEPVSHGHPVAQRTQLQEHAIANPVCKREFEEVNEEVAECKAEVVGCEEYRSGKRSRAELKDPVNDSDSKITSREVLSNCMPSLTPKQSGWGPPRDIEGEEYCLRLRAALAEKYDAKQLEELLASASCRKPVLRVRHMRGRTVDSVTENEGLSYLDHHPDLAEKLANASKLEDKLSLLRGMFFWLQHSCMVGAFKPWLPPPPSQASKEQNGDCFETDGPDCKVTAVVYSLDKTGPMRHSENLKASKASSQSVDQKGGVITSVGQRSSAVQGTVNYRVVLCLPAPTHCQVKTKGSSLAKPSTQYVSGEH